MKAKLIGNNKERGSGILEIIIAVAILTLGISAATLLSFANQTLKTDSSTSGEALYKAKGMLEAARASSTVDFMGITSTTTTDIGSVYTKKLTVSDLTPCRKEVTSKITWQQETRQREIDLTTNLADIAGTLALGGDCASDPPAGGWTAPTTLGSINIGTGQATGIDVIDKIVFLSTEDSAVAKPDFFVVDATDGLNPVILSATSTGPGLNALDVARNQTTGKTYAYVANNDTSDQMQIIDVTVLSNPTLISSADLQPSPLGLNSEAKSIFYYDDKVFVGTGYLPTIGANPPRPEFHIFDVSNPLNPIELGSYDVNHNINNIVVRNKYAYLATSDDAGEVWILNISNPSNPTFVNKFDGIGSEDGDSVYLTGNTLYLGRDEAPSTRPDFYILNVASSTSIAVLGSKNLNMNPNTAKVNSIRVLSRYAFLATGDSNQEFQVLDILNPASIPAPVATYNFPQEATGVDFENKIIYSSVRSNDGLRIIRPAQCSDGLDNDIDGTIDSADAQCHTDVNANNAASYNPEDDNES